MILSDGTIRKLIITQNLIVDACLERVKGCSYRFTPCKIFHGGENRAIIDFTEKKYDAVAPGEYVWVRMRESVKLPKDICAFWWQKNKLSRKGLVLMNMSIVEPGYEGFLSCLFVNFGKTHVSINSETPMAKLVFLKLDQNVITEAKGEFSIQEYENEIHQEALSRPSTFLQVTKQFDEFNSRIKEHFNELDLQVKEHFDKATQDFNIFKENSLNEFKNDIPGAIIKSGGLAAGVLVLLGIISSITPSIQNLFRPPIDDQVAEIVQKELTKWLTIQTKVETNSRELSKTELLQKMAELERRLQEIEEQKTTQ